MERLPDELLELLVEASEYDIGLYASCRRVRDLTATMLETTHGFALDQMLSSMCLRYVSRSHRIRSLRRWRCMSDEWGALCLRYVCSGCGAELYELGTCVECRTPRPPPVPFPWRRVVAGPLAATAVLAAAAAATLARARRPV